MAESQPTTTSNQGNSPRDNRDDNDDDDDEDFAGLFVNEDYRETIVNVPGHAPLRVLSSHAASTDFDLTGQIVWPCGEALCHFMAHHSELLQSDHQGVRVVELGAGCGLSGLFVARQCPANSLVVLTDGIDLVCRLLEDNVLRSNECDERQAGVRVVAHKLDWGSLEDTTRVLRELDHNGPLQQHHKRHYDLVIAADVVQWPEYLPGLLQTARRLLKPLEDDAERAKIEAVAAAATPAFKVGTSTVIEHMLEPRYHTSNTASELLRRPQVPKFLVCYMARCQLVERWFLHFAAVYGFTMGFVDMQPLLPLDRPIFASLQTPDAPKIKLAVLTLD